MRLSKMTRTRLKMTFISDIFCMLIAVYAVYAKMDGVASAAIAGVLTITSMYNYGESTRPSKNVEP